MSNDTKHQGEPVALPARYVHEHHGCFLSERQHGWNACLDEIDKLGPLYSRPVQGEPVAFQCWSCKDKFTLKERADCDGCCWKCGVEIDLEDYADKFAGEVERLTQERDGLRTLADGANKWRQKAIDSQLAARDLTDANNELHAKLAALKEAFNESQEEVVKRGKILAERNALLREVYESAEQDESISAGLFSAIKVVLSGSGEPSGPKCEDGGMCEGSSHKCSSCAPVKIDERAAFEEAVEGIWGFSSNQLCLLSGPDLWKIWQASVALERKA